MRDRLKYQCLVLDHDDTVVNSTVSVNFPAFLDTLRILRPEAAAALTADDYGIFMMQADIFA